VAGVYLNDALALYRGSDPTLICRYPLLTIVIINITTTLSWSV